MMLEWIELGEGFLIINIWLITYELEDQIKDIEDI